MQIPQEKKALVRAEDAIILDNTDLTPQEQLEFALAKVNPFLSKP
jgi:cytidylate kinase